ncbi:basic proline-rich protein-like [Leopardus geoffroyi]|uniref:basic proline-rich protein-like n=1 Tax=Leopardus geoffroyi TaxID=46844 RepID=UPI001E25E261|nr:basic proline-rich protein-like [Leopardus geoffroyi]
MIAGTSELIVEKRIQTSSCSLDGQALHRPRPPPLLGQGLTRLSLVWCITLQDSQLPRVSSRAGVQASFTFRTHPLLPSTSPTPPPAERDPGPSQALYPRASCSPGPASRDTPGSPDPSSGSWASGPLSPEPLRPLWAPQPRTSGALGPGALGPPSAPLAGARRPRPGAEPGRRGRPRWGRPGCSGGPSGSVPPPPRGAATSARSPAAAAARTGRGEAPAEAAAPRPLRARPPSPAAARPPRRASTLPAAAAGELAP